METSTNREKLIDRVRKLFALASNNSSEAEAASAALMAQHLMVEYDIEVAEVEGASGRPNREITEVESEILVGSRKWRFELAFAVARAFRCEILHRRVSRSSNRTVMVFYGYAADAQCASLTFSYLYKTGNRLAKCAENAHRKTYGWAYGVYNSFAIGFLRGIRAELEEQTRALMIVESQEVKDSYKEHCAEIGTKTRSVGALSSTRLYSSVCNQGEQAGRDAIRSRRLEAAGQLALNC